MNDKKFDSNLSVEVQLAWEVMTCKAMRETYDEQTHPCHYFNRHFGPWLAYDWIHEKPRKPLKPDEIKNIEARTNGNRFTVPALAGGCRKAPIMTIGINPNMPSWQLNEEGSRWCYPYFDNIAEYATYYRYQTIFQEQYDIDFLKGFIDPNAAIVAREDGTVNDISYDDAQENIEIKVSYNERGITIPRQCAILCSKGKNFKKGDIIAGQIKLPVGIPTEVEKKTVGYYQLFEKILDIAESKLKVAGLIPHETALHAGEDVLLGDMVACASPGWTAKSGEYLRKKGTKFLQCAVVRGGGWPYNFNKPNLILLFFRGHRLLLCSKKHLRESPSRPNFPRILLARMDG